jgi:hypothetical protein
MRNYTRIILLACLALTLAVVGSVSAKGVPPYAAVEDGALMIYGVQDDPVQVNNPPNKGILSTAWSPDGSMLAYAIITDDYTGQLMVTDLTGENPVALETDRMAMEFPITFTADGEILYVGQGEVPADVNDPYMAQLRTVVPEADAPSQTIGQFAYGTGCGGGSSFPGDWRYWAEAGFGGNDLVLAVVPAGILHSTVCGGGGLALFDPVGGEDRQLAGQPAVQTQETEPITISRAVIAPDGQTVAAVKMVYSEPEVTRSLVLVDVVSGDLTDIDTDAQPDQLAWSPDGTLYYSTREESADLTADITPEQQQTLQSTLGFIPDRVPGYTVSIHHLNLEDGKDDLLYEADAYAIGHMEIPENELVIFSQVANQEAWLAGLLDGTINPMETTEQDSQLAAVPVTLQLLPPQSDTPVILGQNQAQFDLQP